jgi:hypothetical protein
VVNTLIRTVGSRQKFGPAFLKASLQGDQTTLPADDVCSRLLPQPVLNPTPEW